MKIKKILKITGILFLVSVIALFAAPFLFKGKIEDFIKQKINESLNAEVDFAEVDISFLANFPNAKVDIKDLSIINREPFLGDTLMYVQDISAKMSLKELTKVGSEQVVLDAFDINKLVLNLATNEEGVASYDIVKDTGSSSSTNKASSHKGSGLDLKVSEYKILNTEVHYIDEASKMHLDIVDFNHLGTGDLANDVVDLNTKTSMKISLDQNEINYLTNYNVHLDAILNIDQKTSKYTFKENKLLVNQLEMVFDGYLQSLNDGQEMDINFKTPSTSFTNFIALIPSAYSGSVKDVNTQGNFEVSGFVKGIMNETSIPKFVVEVVSNNASVKYPDLPKRIEEINLKTTLANTSGNEKDTYLNIDELSFKIDDDRFKADSHIRNLTGNPLVDAKLDGVLNLSNLSKAYPIQLENELQGILKANLNTAFDMNSVEKEQYQNIKNEGAFSIENFVYSSKDIVNPINISKAQVNFTNQKISLDEFAATTGESDLNATGTIENLLGFLFDGKELKGNFNVVSDYFVVDDFMVDNAETTDASAETKTTKTGEALKIPSFLDASMNANIKKVKYDNLILNNVVGDLIIRDESVALKNMSTNMFDGTMAINGNVSTKEATPKFEMDLGIDQFDISKSFKSFELFQSLTPIAKALKGKLNTTLKLKGDLDDSFSPNLSTLTGNALAEILTAKISPEQAQTLQMLNGELSFIDLEKLDLKDLKTKLSFKDGKVNVKPFNLKYEDIDIEVGGTHGFDQSMDYKATFSVPAKSLGSEVSKLLGQLGDEELANTKIPVVANITGNSTKPVIKTDLKGSIKALTAEIVNRQKDKLIDGVIGGGDAGSIIDGIIGGGKDQDSTDTDKPNLGDTIGGILGNNKKDNDSTANDNDDPDVGDVIGGLLGKKKKKKKDD